MLAWLLHILLSTIFAVYIHLRRLSNTIFNRISSILNHHHRSPERFVKKSSENKANSRIIKRDVKNLSKVPQHLSVVLSIPNEPKDVTLLLNRLDILINDACEVAAWCTAAGIPVLSIYEKSGLLKSSLTHLYGRIDQTLHAYYGGKNAQKPTFSLRAPNLPSYSPPNTPELDTDNLLRPHLNIILLDASDGRQILVDLTKTLAEMSQNGKIQTHDISPELIDAELSESVMGEPDLLILFGDKVMLDGYPPWQVRLTEIFAIQDNSSGVGYNCFLRGLYKYAKAEMRLGR